MALTDTIDHRGTMTGRWAATGGRMTHTVYPKMVMVVVGTLGLGFEFYGPFKNTMAAERWAKKNVPTGMTVLIEQLNFVKEDT